MHLSVEVTSARDFVVTIVFVHTSRRVESLIVHSVRISTWCSKATYWGGCYPL